MLRTICTCTGMIIVMFVASANAQNQRGEYVESSSPLAGGGRVVSRSTPTSRVQTVTVPSTNQNENERLTFGRPTEGGSTQGRPVQSQPGVNRESVFRQSVVPNTAGQAATYPYPAANRLPVGNRPARTALFHQPVRATATCTNCAVPYQIPTLGLTNSVQTARQSLTSNDCCTPQAISPPASLTVPAAQSPVLQLQAPANQVPSLSVQDPGQATTFAGQGFQTQINPNIGVPQFGAQRNSFLSPFVTGSGAYQPIVRIANMPPGTYLGQGIIGQPTAYVDGQPIRNLFRYIFP